MSWLWRFFICMAVSVVLLYSYIHKQNQLTVLQMKVPLVQKKLKLVEDEIAYLQCEKEKFENPVHLMELLRQPQFAHLKHPCISDIIEITLPPGDQSKGILDDRAQ